ncbi:hypothetical protein B0H17DRAFT_1127238 [Mycena rosella]|uniref:Uncharacterized protein n=1 Tax=Mycena rosella TaxID=1033263 RepID=A0AAD7GRG6_MYCRO|nr:hypothetical protein B0H17DRAFT_1127238 [Mycena rosella]
MRPERERRGDGALENNQHRKQDGWNTGADPRVGFNASSTSTAGVGRGVREREDRGVIKDRRGKGQNGRGMGSELEPRFGRLESPDQLDAAGLSILLIVRQHELRRLDERLF